MISLEQIRNLESKVHTAVSRIKTLSEENATLKQRLESYEARITELQTLVSAFKADQDEIEAGIVSALKHLDELEDSVGESAEREPARSSVDATPVSEPEQDSVNDAEGVKSGTGAPARNVAPEGETESGNDPSERSDDEEPEDEDPELDIF